MRAVLRAIRCCGRCGAADVLWEDVAAVRYGAADAAVWGGCCAIRCCGRCCVRTVLRDMVLRTLLCEGVAA